MVQPVNSSASLATSHAPRNNRRRWGAPVEPNDLRKLPKTLNGPRRLSAASIIPRPVMPAEVAQARVFEGLLQAESAELRQLAHRIAGAGDHADDNPSAPSWDLLQISARIEEVQHLLQALQGRFPHQGT